MRKNTHYKKIREGDGICALHIESTTNDDDGNYTVMAANPQVAHCQLPVHIVNTSSPDVKSDLMFTDT